MGVAAFGAAFALLVQIIGKIAAAKVWRLQVRMWAYTHQAPIGPTAEDLEEWVHAAARHLEVFGGQRREELRMWAYEQAQQHVPSETPLMARATALYDWVVLAEDAPGIGPGRLRIPTKRPSKRRKRA